MGSIGDLKDAGQGVYKTGVSSHVLNDPKKDDARKCFAFLYIIRSLKHGGLWSSCLGKFSRRRRGRGSNVTRPAILDMLTDLL